MQLIADYYAFASPAITGQWRVQVQGQIWQLGFRGGELVCLETPAGEHDLLSFLHEVGSISESNLSVLRAFPESDESRRDQVLAELVGSSDALIQLRRKHALHSIGHMFCLEADRNDFSSLPPTDVTGMGLEALALPYIALRLQPPEQLHASLGDAVNQAFRLSRNPKIPVAGLQLDHEALNVAKLFTKPKSMDAVINGHSRGAEALVTYATVLTLLGCEMLCPAELSEVEEKPLSSPPQMAAQPRVRPPNLKPGSSFDADGFERVPTGVAPPIAMDPPADKKDEDEGFERVDTGVAPPIDDEGAVAAEAKPPRTDATIARFLEVIDANLITDAETMLERLDVSAARKSVLGDYLNAQNPRNPDRGQAMTVALTGLQEFTDKNPEDHLGALLLSRIYDGAENPAMAKIFAEQAQRLGGHTDEVSNWKPTHE